MIGSDGETPNKPGVDPDTFREGMSWIPTVVTVVTVPDAAGPCGVTIGSFASLSLEPPLVSYNLTKSAAIYPDAVSADHFAVHVLTSEQSALSDRFAIPDLTAEEQLRGVDVHTDGHGVPLLEPFLVRFRCRNYDVRDGGDHSIIVGLVEDIEYGDSGSPAIYYRRGYHSVGDSEAGGDIVSPAEPVPKKAKS